jgi:hypothetical protein
MYFLDEIKANMKHISIEAWTDPSVKSKQHTFLSHFCGKSQRNHMQSLS